MTQKVITLTSALYKSSKLEATAAIKGKLYKPCCLGKPDRLELERCLGFLRRSGNVPREWLAMFGGHGQHAQWGPAVCLYCFRAFTM